MILENGESEETNLQLQFIEKTGRTAFADIVEALPHSAQLYDGRVVADVTPYPLPSGRTGIWRVWFDGLPALGQSEFNINQQEFSRLCRR